MVPADYLKVFIVFYYFNPKGNAFVLRRLTVIPMPGFMAYSVCRLLGGANLLKTFTLGTRFDFSHRPATFGSRLCRGLFCAVFLNFAKQN